MLEVIAKSSPKSFHELRIYNYTRSESLPEDLESFFINWGNRLPRKTLTLIIHKDSYNERFHLSKENITTIEKYKKFTSFLDTTIHQTIVDIHSISMELAKIHRFLQYFIKKSIRLIK